MNLLRFIGYANSNQLQTEIKRRFENGFVFQGFYTFQKTLTTSEGGNNTFGNLQLLPAALTNNASTDERLRSIYSNDSGLPRHTLSVNANYELPFGRGKHFASNANGFLNRLVSGWNASGFYYWRSGLYFSPYYTVGGSNTILAPGKSGVLPVDQRSADRWFDPSINRADLGQPYNGETFIRRANPLENDYLNNIPRSYMSGPGFYNVDASFYKVTPITERGSPSYRSADLQSAQPQKLRPAEQCGSYQRRSRRSANRPVPGTHRVLIQPSGRKFCLRPSPPFMAFRHIAPFLFVSTAGVAGQLILPSEVLTRDRLVPVTYRLAGQITGDAKVSMRWTDSLGRVIEDRTFRVSLADEDEFTFPIDVRRAVAMRNQITVHFSIDGRNLKGPDHREDDANVTFTARPSNAKWSDYEIVMWQQYPANLLPSLEKLGITAGQYSGRESIDP